MFKQNVWKIKQNTHLIGDIVRSATVVENENDAWRKDKEKKERKNNTTQIEII